MFTSLRSRLWLTYALLIAVVLVIIAAALVFFLLRNPVSDRLETARLRVAAAALSSGRLAAGFQQNPQQAVRRADEVLDVRVIMSARDGLDVVDSRGASHPPLPVQDIQLVDRSPLPIRQLRDSQGQVWLYAASTVQDRFIAVVATPRPQARLSAIFTDDLLPLLLQAGGLALLLSLLLAFLISRWVARPLQRISSAAHAAAAGHYRQIDLHGPSEVQAVASAFNEMTSRVQASQQSQRDFVANVSHELKTPLTSIQGFAQAIKDDTASTPEALEQAAGVIYDEAGRMHRLVVDLLDLARLDAGTAELERTPLDIAVLLRGVADKLKPQSDDARVQLSTEINPLPSFIGDGDRLSQVFTNLVDNAVKYTPAGGEVLLRARQANGSVEISVADNGPGISPDELSRIFERFYQVDKSRRGGEPRGVGLGLAIARQIVYAHGGDLSAYSEPGRGSVFVVTLPVAQPDDDTMASRRVL